MELEVGLSGWWGGCHQKMCGWAWRGGEQKEKRIEPKTMKKNC